MTARISDNGLPRSIATTNDFPDGAYLGALIFCEADKTLYVYNGEEYEAVTSVASEETEETSSITQLTVVAKVADLPSEEGDGAVEGALVFVTSTKAPYVYTGSAWKKVTIDA